MASIEKIELSKFAESLKGAGLTPGEARFRGKKQRYCELANWQGRGRKSVSIHVYVGRYLGPKLSFWVGFASEDADVIIELKRKYKTSLRGRGVASIGLNWNDNLKLDTKKRKELKHASGVAFERYDEPGYIAWFGIYLPLNIHSADHAYDFVMKIFDMNPQAIGGRFKHGPTEKEARRRERLTQGKFRSDQMKVWGGRCSVTSVGLRSILQASHIMPWASAKTAAIRNSQDNGLLLVPTLHKLFDDGLISFSDKGTLIHQKLRAAELKNLRLTEPMKIRTRLTAQQRKYLRVHRRNFKFP